MIEGQVAMRLPKAVAVRQGRWGWWDGNEEYHDQGKVLWEGGHMSLAMGGKA